MKIFLWLLLILPTVVRGQSVSVASSPDWQPLSPAQAAAVEKQVKQFGGQLLDASVYSGGGTATLMSDVIKQGVNQPNAKNFVDSFIQGVVEKGPKLLDRQPARIGQLPGTSLLFQGEANGQTLGMVSFVVFSNQEAYLLTFYAPKPMVREEPMVASYLARIQVEPSVVAGDLQSSVPIGIGFSENQFAYHLGQFTFYVLLAAFVLWLILRRKKTPKPPPLPF